MQIKDITSCHNVEYFLTNLEKKKEEEEEEKETEEEERRRKSRRRSCYSVLLSIYIHVYLFLKVLYDATTF